MAAYPARVVAAGSTTCVNIAVLIWIRALSWPTDYPLAFDSLKGCTYPMPMDFSALLRRLLTDNHIDFTSLKGGA